MQLSTEQGETEIEFYETQLETHFFMHYPDLNAYSKEH